MAACVELWVDAVDAPSLLQQLKDWFWAQDGFADDAFAFAEHYADFFQAAKYYLDNGGEEHPLDWKELHQHFLAQFEGRLEAFLASRGSDLEGLQAALQSTELESDEQAKVMLELMLNISDYQPWLKSMLSLADERNRGETVHEDPEPPDQGCEDSGDDLDAAELAARIGARLGDGAGGASPVPVFFYGAAREDLRPLAELRRCLGYFSGAAKGEWCGLSEDMKQAMVQLPADRGPVGQVDDRHGVAVVGAVPWVHNYNLLIVADLEEVELMRRCRRIAKSISERGGGLDKVETMALPHEKGVEVACNLLDADITPPAKSSAAWALSALLVPAVEAALAVTRQEPGDIMEASAEGDEAFLNKFSRQNAAFGAEVTMKMTKMRALVVGCSGVAVEIVKNLVLQGLGAVSALREFHSTCDKAATCRLTLALHMALQCGYALHHT
eukprot:s1622_g13.t1